MDITITGRGVEIPDRFEDYATEKSEKVAHLAEKAIVLEIRVIRHHETGGSTGDDRVELTLIGPGPVVRAEAAAGDKYAAFDLALDKLLERIRQAKDRKKIHRGARRPESLGEAASSGRVAETVWYAGIQVGSQPYSPSQAIVPVSKGTAPWLSKSPRIPGTSSSAANNPRCNKTCGWRPCGTPFRGIG